MIYLSAQSLMIGGMRCLLTFSSCIFLVLPLPRSLSRCFFKSHTTNASWCLLLTRLHAKSLPGAEFGGTARPPVPWGSASRSRSLYLTETHGWHPKFDNLWKWGRGAGTFISFLTSPPRVPSVCSLWRQTYCE